VTILDNGELVREKRREERAKGNPVQRLAGKPRGLTIIVAALPLPGAALRETGRIGNFLIACAAALS
jgi:hypothetical protein